MADQVRSVPSVNSTACLTVAKSSSARRITLRRLLGEPQPSDSAFHLDARRSLMTMMNPRT